MAVPSCHPRDQVPDLLGDQRPNISAVTVRGVCRRAGLAARYFYESFTDKDEFVSCVFDWVIAELAATTQAAVAAVPTAEQTRAGMANIVRTITDDAVRVARLDEALALWRGEPFAGCDFDGLRPRREWLQNLLSGTRVERVAAQHAVEAVVERP